MAARKKVRGKKKSVKRIRKKPRKRIIRKVAKKRVVRKKRVKRKKSNGEYRLEPITIRLPRGKSTHRTEAILICPKCKSENIRVIDYQGIRCVVCRDCKFDERDIYDVAYTERNAPKVKAVFKAGGHLRTVKKK